MNTPASTLTGQLLNDRWQVHDLLGEKQGQTGGCFSCQYKVVDLQTGKEAFLKAIDLFKKAKAKGKPLSTALLDKEESIRSFRYESKLLDLCEGKNMARIVRSLDTGIHDVPLEGLEFSLEVPFIVFELAEGDLRTHPDRNIYDLSWRLRVFHGVAVAMSQLHRAEIAHQDLKPSNVLVFDNDFSKIGDLGRATLRNEPSAYEEPGHTGDSNYIPFELLYGHTHPMPWQVRRFGADFFMLGCVLTYLVTDSSFLVLTLDRLDKQFWPGTARDYGAALPHLQRAVEDVIGEIKGQLPQAIRDEVCGLIYRLSDPDYTTRGWPRKFDSEENWSRENTHLGRFDLQQVISHCDSLSTKAGMENLVAAPIGDKRKFLEFFFKSKQ